jgi:phenylpropionate dioxygenase-like ring-hydroxylating dioxygenase large terminal subunit
MIERRIATPCTNDAIVDQWHVVGAVDAVGPDAPLRTRLLETDVLVTRADDGRLSVVADDIALPWRERYGCIWTSLGDPPDLFDIPEYREPDRRNLFAGSLAVHVSAPRAVENFLDMGHFPFVHTYYLGVAPFTEVRPYTVRLSDDEGLLATECRFFQPRANAAATEGADVDYAYRVPHPHAAVLYKSAPGAPGRMDIIALIVQAIDQDHVIGHLFGSFIDTVNSDVDIRIFSQLIFAQDKPILENQRPKRLPLDLRAELPVRSDAASVAYRRWLQQLGVTYGTVPAASGAENTAIRSSTTGL